MKATSLILIMLALFPWPAWSGQPGHVELGLAYSVDNRLGLLGSWHDGLAVTASACRTLRGQVQIEARLSYRHAAFEEYRGYSPPHVPEIQFSEYHGDPSDIFTLSVGPRLTGTGATPTYVGFRAGALLMWVGDVSRRHWDMNEPDEQYLSHARGTGELTTEPFLAGAIGVALPFGSRRVWLEGEIRAFPRLAALSFSLGSCVRFGPV